MVVDAHTIHMIHSFAIMHATSTGALVSLADRAETPRPDGTFEFSAATAGALVCSTILSAAAMLEAVANEFFSACAPDHVAHRNDALPAEHRHRATLIWDARYGDTEKFSVLNKFDTALILMGSDPFDHGGLVYQDANLVIALRNFLVHSDFVANTVLSDIPGVDVTVHNFEKKLRRKFQENPRTGAGNPFFPDKCLSSGCARWAFNSSINFVDAFYQKLGILPPYEHVRAAWHNL